MNRRRFLALAAAAGASAALSACGDGDLSGVGQVVVDGGGMSGGGGGGGSGNLTIKVGDFDDLASPGTWVRIPSTSIAVKRTGSATFAALSMSCTHQGCLTDIVNGTSFSCPCHFSRFDTNGSVTNGPAAEPLGTFSTSYDAPTDILTIT